MANHLFAASVVFVKGNNITVATDLVACGDVKQAQGEAYSNLINSVAYQHFKEQGFVMQGEVMISEFRESYISDLIEKLGYVKR